ncbi:unnamed protein product [Rhizoctonia solani]|uniref:Peptidase C14 caspase domain-containing protein n=1 Tax=Rhizoctonia solani TaxID=456999 RepID=A0A8H3HCA9_9AGAM|nr:unnamed protein product [Rhizoctonia solani]
MLGGAMIPDSRGQENMPVASYTSPFDRKELVAFIRRAMEDGNMLPNPPNIEPARRRALIIAPQYREPGQNFDPLPTTAADVKLIHELLGNSVWLRTPKHSYSLRCVQFQWQSPSDPGEYCTLDWLVAGATEGDYRFLHFSGHGNRVETDSSKGKEGRIVKSGNWPVMPGAWDSELSVDNVKSGRVVEQTIAESELVYYNEAIITRISEENEPELNDEEEPDSAGKIWDQELNAYLSKLPKGCTITVLYYGCKCCASGRILNLSRKLQGSGFRGKPTQPTTTFSPLIIPPPPSKSYNQENAPSSPGIVSPTFSSMANIVSTMVNVLPQMVRYARVAMQEGIPERERNMDGIQARIFAWSACHQRQLSWDSDDCTNGLLTQTFTETCIRLGGTIDLPTRYTYNTLFEEVSKSVAEKRATSVYPAPQFVQLWTSLREENRTIETSLLDSHVEF